MKKIIHTDDAPKAIGPYSQAVQAGDFLFISGQIPLDPKTMQIAGFSAHDQTQQVFLNIKAILDAANLTFESIVKMTVLLADINDFAAVNEVYASYFNKDFPARAAYAVLDLPKGAKVEIEAIAYTR